MWDAISTIKSSVSRVTDSIREFPNRRTANYQRNKTISDENSSVLPFKAFPGDRDGINILYSSMKSGSRIISTDETLSVPANIMQFDHGGGFNRIVMTGPAYGKVIDKVGNPVYDAGFMVGSGYHQFTQGNMFISGGEVHQCFGNVREMETEDSKHQKLYKIAQSRSSLTMYGKNADNTLKQYDQYYERHLATIIEGRNIIASRDLFSYKCGSRIVLESTKNYNVTPDNKSLYEEVDNIKNSGAQWESTADSYNEVAAQKTEDNLPDISSVGIDLISEEGTIVIRAKKIKIEADSEIQFIAGSQYLLGTVNIPSLRAGSFCRGCARFPSGEIDNINAIDPHVKISRGYDEIPENQKACVESQQDGTAQY